MTYLEFRERLSRAFGYTMTLGPSDLLECAKELRRLLMRNAELERENRKLQKLYEPYRRLDEERRRQIEQEHTSHPGWKLQGEGPQVRW